MSRPKKKKKVELEDFSEDYDFPLVSSSTRMINKSNKIRYDEGEDTARKKPSKKLSRDSIIEEDMRQCFDLLQTLTTLPQAPPFLEPLDYNALGLYLYPTIIKVPMDFGSIKSMLLHNTLANPDHFADHVRLVCRNAMEFNQEGSPVHIQAAELLDWFETHFAELMARLYPDGAQGNGDAMDVEKNDGELTMEEHTELAQKAAQIEEENAHIASLKQSIENLKREARKPRLKFVRLSQPHPPLSYREKEAIAKKIAELPPDNVPGLLEIIQAAQPPSAGEDGEVEVDIERLDDSTLLKIEAYVDRCMAVRSHKRSQAPSKSKSRPSGSSSKSSSSAQKRQRPPNTSAPSTKKAAPIDTSAVDRKDIASAQAATKKRTAEIQKQIQGVDKAKGLLPGMTIAINPEDPAEGFWIGNVTAPPSNGQVMVQWFEMRDRATTDLTADTRSYTKSPNYDLIPVETIMFGIDIKLHFDQEKQLWVLNGVRDIMAMVRSLE